MNAMKTSVFGLGKLGAPLAGCLAARGFEVIGVDPDASKVEAINRGRAPIVETGLAELVGSAAARLSATTDGGEAVKSTEVSFIVVPTPSEPDGGFSLRYVLEVCEIVGDALAAKDGYHLVVLTSTVMPGSTGGSVRQTLEKLSGKKAGLDFGLCFSPEFVALGSVVHDLLSPDFVLIGESDQLAGDLLESIYHRLCENDPPVARMTFINAELTKLAVNTYMTTKISFANMIAHICERLPGADADVVSGALGLDSRIGRKYLKGATGFGGPCFPRDNRALVTLARQVGAPATLAEATDQFNVGETQRLAEQVFSRVPRGGKVAILGLSYKPNTDVVERSAGLMLAEALIHRSVRVIGFDPAALDNARKALGGQVSFASSAADAALEADVVVITTPWEEFRNLSVSDSSKPGVIIDCWGVLDAKVLPTRVSYIRIGLGPEDGSSQA